MPLSCGTEDSPEIAGAPLAPADVPDEEVDVDDEAPSLASRQRWANAVSWPRSAGASAGALSDGAGEDAAPLDPGWPLSSAVKLLEITASQSSPYAVGNMMLARAGAEAANETTSPSGSAINAPTVETLNLGRKADMKTYRSTSN